MFRTLKVASVGALFLGLVIGAAGIARSDNASQHTNYITFSRGVALPGVELAAGTYIFETPTNSMSNSIVRVSSRDRRKVFLTAYTKQVERPKNDNGKLVVTIGEAAPGSVPPVSAWFPIGESVGHQFVYGK
jgi:hypothetical protein